MFFFAFAAALGVAAVIEVPAVPGALNDAVDAIASHQTGTSSSTIIKLARGRHQLTRPIRLTPAHSGLRFIGVAPASAGEEAGSTISGGVAIDPTTWTKYAEAKCYGCGWVMRAPLPAGTNYSRHLYVNNVRANWTMALFPTEGSKVTATGYSVPPATAAALNWTHRGGSKIEMVYRGTRASGAQWTESRTPATAFDVRTGAITMASSGFKAGLNKPYGQHLNLPEYYQNSFELLGEAQNGKPGDWYLDLHPNDSTADADTDTGDADATHAGSAGFVYFVTVDGSVPPPSPSPPGGPQCAANHGTSKPCCNQPGDPVPLPYQCPATAPTCADYIYKSHYGHCVTPSPTPPPSPPKPPPPIHAMLPQLEMLVHGTAGTKVTPPPSIFRTHLLFRLIPSFSQDLAWSNVVFADATWLRPSSDVGFVEMQAGCTCSGVSPHYCTPDDSLWVPTTANILMEGVHGATFDKCTFTRLGACGVSFEGGSQNNSITRSTFSDISASALSIGRTNTYNLTEKPLLHDAGNILSDSVIEYAAQEYHGAPGIAVFYARDTHLVHNEIKDLPYTGISIGWGWGRTMEIMWPRMPWDAGNDISNNNIHDVMQMLGDGGAIYTLGPQGNRPYPKGPSGKTYPAKPVPPLQLLPPSTMNFNYIHDTGPDDGIPDAPGAGSHFPGGLYNDEGTTNWEMVGNVVVDTPAWLQGCRFNPGWIGYVTFANNSIACDKKQPHSSSGCTIINHDNVCPNINNKVVNSRSSLSPAAQSVMAAAGPRP
jgi:hypothetical protein